MDIPAFVGFAASGPLHTPVPINDAEQFEQVFGNDAPLAWDPQRCRQINAQLGPAVRSFFLNGGRRCWVIRVASDEAESNFFPVPGLAMAELDDAGKVTRVQPAFARARSEGSWSDSLKSSSALLTQPFETLSVSRADGTQEGASKDSLVVELRGSPGNLLEGDLLRLSFNDAVGTILVAMLVLDSVSETPDRPPSNGSHLIVSGAREVWLRPAEQDRGLETTSASASIDATVEENREQAGPVLIDDDLPAEIHWPKAAGEELEVYLRASIEKAPAVGSLVRLKDAGGTSLMTISDSGPGDSPTFGRAVRLLGAGSRVMPAPQPIPDSLPLAEKLRFELWVRRGAEEATRLGELGFNAPHPRFWGDLPTEKQVHVQQEYGQPAGAIEAGRIALAFDKQRAELGQDFNAQRFPLAGTAPRSPVYFPIGMTALPSNYLARLQTETTPLMRDGLSRFDASLFLDGELVEPGISALSAQADFLRYTSPRPRPLLGAHAALGIEEATIISIPDAIHRGWERAIPLPRPMPEPSKPIVRPEWLHFLDCKDKTNQAGPETASPERGHFLGCDSDPPNPPCLISSDPDRSGSLTLKWSLCSPPSSPPADARFILEQATSPNFSDAVVLYRGGDESYTVYGLAPGEYFYRVRVESLGHTSDWSNGEGVRVTGATDFVQKTVEQSSPTTLLAVHRALLRMCAARGDIFAVLSMPEHYREDNAESYAKALKSPTAPAIDVNSRFKIEIDGRVETRQIHALSMPLSAGEASAFSYAAVYHPWLIGGDQRDRFSGSPPDGAVCGVIAARALNRGAWIAPANEAIRGPVALTPPLNRERWLDLQEAQINIIRQDPRGFMSMSADTLGDDDLRPIGVRRLLSLMRRLALRLGATYVFEPNDPSFRRSVQRGFEGMLGEMFARGAFAGTTPQTSFQVVTGESLNTRQSVEQGRFIVELRVAPSLPLTFMTVRLVQTGDRSFVVETR